MVLKNKRELYSITNESNGMKLQGEVTYNVESTNLTLSGSINNSEGAYLGNFHYNEHDEEKVDKSINGVDKDNISDVEDLIDATITALHTELNNA